MGIIVVWTFTLPFAMPFIVAELIFNLRSAGAHVGRQMAGYALASIPMLILFILFSYRSSDLLLESRLEDRARDTSNVHVYDPSA